MPEHPYVLLSAAVSVDGYLDDAGPRRLLLSNPEDFDRVDELRANCDAILVGAGTVRADNPRLLVRADQRRAARRDRGQPEHPLKIVVSGGGGLTADSALWHTGGPKLVFSTDAGAVRARGALGSLAEVVALGTRVDFGALLDELAGRGVGRLLVEGGGHIHTALLTAGLADELQLAVAPVLVGDERAPRFLHPGRYPGGPTRRLRLVGASTVGDVALLRYLIKGGPETHTHRASR